MTSKLELKLSAYNGYECETTYEAVSPAQWGDVLRVLEGTLSSAVQAQATAEPVAWMCQHNETGRITFVDQHQIDNGWAAGNTNYSVIKPLYSTPPATQSAWISKLEAAYEAGWIEAACWAKRDDLIADIGSPAYISDRFAHLDSIATPPEAA